MAPMMQVDILETKTKMAPTNVWTLCGDDATHIKKKKETERRFISLQKTKKRPLSYGQYMKRHSILWNSEQMKSSSQYFTVKKKMQINEVVSCYQCV